MKNTSEVRSAVYRLKYVLIANNESIEVLVLSRNRCDEIGHIKRKAADIIQLNILISQISASDTGSRRNTAPAALITKYRPITIRYFTLHEQNWLSS